MNPRTTVYAINNYNFDLFFCCRFRCTHFLLHNSRTRDAYKYYRWTSIIVLRRPLRFIYLFNCLSSTTTRHPTFHPERRQNYIGTGKTIRFRPRTRNCTRQRNRRVFTAFPGSRDPRWNAENSIFFLYTVAERLNNVPP